MICDSDRFSNAARRVCELAAADAARLKHPLVGTEHLVCAMMGDPKDNIGKRVLTLVGVQPAQLLQQLLALEIPLSGRRPPLPLAPLAGEVFMHAVHLARSKSRMVGPEHLLLAMLDRPTCAAAQMLTAIGVSADVLRVRLMQALED